MSPSRQSLGKHGENLAVQHLARQGHQIIERNWHCPRGELDIITQDGQEWVFVEVRTRRAKNTNSAIDSVSSRKQGRIVAAAQAYVEAHQLEDQPWRIDLVVVALTPLGPKIEVIENAVGW